MKENRKAMVMAAFCADALSLGVHWIYDTGKISLAHGRVEAMVQPPKDSYHPTKNRGDFTHYGDQMLILLASIAEKKKFDLGDFSGRWRRLFADYDGYVDGATRKTLANYDKGKEPETAGSSSSDFAGATRIAPLASLFARDEEALVAAARAQTGLTHLDPLVKDTAEFFSRTAVRVLQGKTPEAAMFDVVSLPVFEMSPILLWVEQGLKSADDNSVAAIGRFGQACGVSQVFSGVVHLIAKYSDDLREALIQSVMAGGESAARGTMVGMVLGAYLGIDALPWEWVNALNKRDEIFSLLEEIL